MATSQISGYAPPGPQNNQNPIAGAIPGFNGISSDVSNLIKQLMSGQLTTGSRRAIFDAGAERGTASGMPGSTGMAGSLFANADLRNIGRASEDQQQRGFQDFLALIQGLSGTVVPTTGQQQQAAESSANNLFRDNQMKQQGIQQEYDYMQKYKTANPQPPRYTRRQLTPGYVPGGYQSITT